MDAIKLDAKIREPGKGSSRAARRNKEVPCILYGHNLASVPFQVGELDLRPLIYTSEFHRVEVTVESNTFDCFLKKVDFHPVSDRPIHADFQILKEGEMITISVPFKVSGTSIGQRNRGRPQVFHQMLEVRCLPKDIPDHFEVDVSDLGIGEIIHLEDLADERFEFSLPMSATLFTVLMARDVEEEEEGELEGEGLLEEGAEGAEGAEEASEED